MFKEKVKDIYIRAVSEIGDVPVVVANDGDVTALAGSMSLDEGRVLGIAMGTSEAAGYVDENRNITRELWLISFLIEENEMFSSPEILLKLFLDSIYSMISRV